MRNWFPVIRRRLGIVWGITRRNLNVQRKYPVDYLYRLFPSVKDSLYAILIGAALTMTTSEYPKTDYAHFLLGGYIVWASVSGSFYNVVSDYNIDVRSRSALTMYLYGASFIELALGYAFMQTINAILFSIPFIITLGLLGVNLAIGLPALASIIYLYCLSWLFFFGLGLAFLGLNIVYKHVAMPMRLAYDAIAIFSGLAFTVQVIPEPFKSLVFLFPTYYLLTTTRFALLNGILPPNLPLYLIAAPCITAAALVVGVLLLKRCVRVAKRRGILWTY